MRILSFAIILFILSEPMAVADQTCPPLKMITSVDARIGSDGRPYVPVKINGAPKLMLVDTGGSFTGITETVADDLKLERRHSDVVFIGVSGHTTRMVAHGAFALGNLRADSMDFMMLDSEPEMSAREDEAAGLLGANLLQSYDLDLDFGAKKINLLSQKHCDGNVVYWPNNGVAVVPMQVNSSGHVMVPVELDGHRLTALLDTGASISVVNLEVAQATLGLTPGDTDTPLDGSLAGAAKSTTYKHRFKSLSLEGVAIANPSLRLIPDLMRPQMHGNVETGTRLGNPSVQTGLGDMILGMDILHHLHVYVAYKERKLYISGAETPQPAVAAATGSPTANATPPVQAEPASVTK